MRLRGFGMGWQGWLRSDQLGSGLTPSQPPPFRGRSSKRARPDFCSKRTKQNDMRQAALISAGPSAPMLGSWRPKTPVHSAFPAPGIASHRRHTAFCECSGRAQCAPVARTQSALSEKSGDSWSGRLARGMRSTVRSCLESAGNRRNPQSGTSGLCALSSPDVGKISPARWLRLWALQLSPSPSKCSATYEERRA